MRQILTEEWLEIPDDGKWNDSTEPIVYSQGDHQG